MEILRFVTQCFQCSHMFQCNYTDVLFTGHPYFIILYLRHSSSWTCAKLSLKYWKILWCHTNPDEWMLFTSAANSFPVMSFQAWKCSYTFSRWFQSCKVEFDFLRQWPIAHQWSKHHTVESGCFKRWLVACYVPSAKLMVISYQFRYRQNLTKGRFSSLNCFWKWQQFF